MPRSFNGRFRPSASIAIFCAMLATTAPTLAQSPDRTFAYDIPAQPLGDALLALGRQSGLQISFPPAAVAGKVSSALRGETSALAALNQLLAGSGLALRADGPGRYIVFVDKTNPFSVSRLEPVRVYGEQIGGRVYSREEIAQTPSSNRDLSTLVATHPAVRTNPGVAGSQNRGSLDVEEISFYGSSPYQNLYRIDGMDATNRVDPASKNLNLKIGNVPSNSQSYFIDTSLLEDVRVYDSFVPVEYGRFTGGVVDAQLRRFSGKNELKLDYRWNTSNMTRQRIAPREENNWARGKPGFSPKWKKQFYSAVGDIAVSDKAGMVLAISQRQSRIARAVLGVDDTGGQVYDRNNYRDRVDNFLGKFSVRASANTTADLTLKYSDRRETLASDTFRDTHWDHNHRAYGLGGNLEHVFQGGRVTLQAGWDHALSNRKSPDNELITHVVLPLPQYTSGGFGREQTQQDTWAIKSRVDLDPLRTGTFTHNAYAGVELQQLNAGFKRFQDSYSLYRTHHANGTYTDRSKSHYLPGTIDVKYRMEGLYLSDRIEWRRVALDAGLRYDHEGFLHTSNVAPRTRLDWDMFGSGNTLLSAGWSRYYGAEVLETALGAERQRLSRLEIDGKGNPVAGSAKPYMTEYAGLRMPHDDEWAISLRQRIATVEGRINYVRRNGRDQWSRRLISKDDPYSYRYTNDGGSTTDSIYLMLKTLEPWRVGKTRWNLVATWSWQKRKTNNDLVEGYDGDARDPDERIIYNNAEIRAIDLPPASFYQPQAATLTLIGAYPRLGITWSNMLNWRGRRAATVYDGRGPAPAHLDRYKSADMPSYWTWDTKLTWQPTVGPNLELTVEVLNLLNRMPAVAPSNPRRRAGPNTYQSGRELWLQVGYRF
ncbi:TonB-dependent receptor plug domain-containing protein [Achromobacter xylosoxidans]|uniref:TonB-dependent receptor plug domain-containing protein n=1 Tax=Alcaligenes xylosoxydans xylosoxydans TaxID=85698 RepID=UPI001F2B4E5A|nr:TonB-dependent receptor plug domain-containing protein [Achromobacter xylosoxidans]